jgi:hypothetical protein
LIPFPGGSVRLGFIEKLDLWSGFGCGGCFISNLGCLFLDMFQIKSLCCVLGPLGSSLLQSWFRWLERAVYACCVLS